MITFDLPKVRKILCLGAHPDDIEIGCGGSLLKMIRINPDMDVHWVVFSGSTQRKKEARESAKNFLHGVGKSKVVVKNFKESFFPTQWAEIKMVFESINNFFQPDLVLTQYRDDRHQDHRVLSDLTWNTFRDHWILEYEIPKYDGDLGQPNVLIPLDEDTCRLKVSFLLRCFTSQRTKHWFTEELFLSILRLRGMECASRYAEGFHCRKMVL